MSAPKAGDDFPDGVTFMWVPYGEDKAGITACGLPVKYDASKGCLHF
jgi:alkyl hydroperoxide reductase 1